METKGMVVDSNVFIDHLRAKDKSNTILRKIPIDQEVFVSSVTIYELFIGANNPSKWDDVKKVTYGLTVLPFDDTIAKRAAKIFLELKKANNLIECRDIFIAATVLSYQIPILTLNLKDFERIRGVKVIDASQLIRNQR